MKSYLKLLPLAVAALMVSCNDLEQDTKTTQGFTGCYAIVTDTNTGTVTISSQVTIGLGLNWTQETAEAAISGLTINNATYPQLSLLDLKWRVREDKLWAQTTNDPVGVLSTNQPVDVTRFTFEWSDRLDIPNLLEYDPALVYGFTLDGRYRIEGSRYPFNLFGKTTADSEGVQPFTGEVNRIVAKPDFDKMTMTVLINGAQFADRMPPLNIQLDNIPMQFVDGGKSFTFSAESIVPTIANVPYENYMCSNVQGTLDPAVGMNFSFDCNVQGMKVYKVITNPTVFGYRE